MSSIQIWNKIFLYRLSPVFARRAVSAYLKDPVPLMPLPPGTYVRQHRLEDPTFRSIQHLQTSGVLVVHAGSGMGTTTACRSVLRQLQEAQHIRGAFLLNGDDRLCDEASRLAGLQPAIVAEIKRHCGIPQNNKVDSIPDLIPPIDSTGMAKPAIIFIDHFEHLINYIEPQILKSSVVGLAESATSHKSFLILIAIRNPKLYKVVLDWNDRQKIYAVPIPADFKWETTELEAVAKAHHSTDKVLSLLPVQTMGEFVSRADGCVGQLLEQFSLHKAK